MPASKNSFHCILGAGQRAEGPLDTIPHLLVEIQKLQSSGYAAAKKGSSPSVANALHDLVLHVKAAGRKLNRLMSPDKTVDLMDCLLEVLLPHSSCMIVSHGPLHLHSLCSMVGLHAAAVVHQLLGRVSRLSWDHGHDRGKGVLCLEPTSRVNDVQDRSF
jgi:hypothetical protein